MQGIWQKMAMGALSGQNPGILLGAAGIVLLLLFFAVRERVRARRLADSIGRMLVSATRGDFSEDTFDESRLSKLETEFVHYLGASALSARAAVQERDKIKTLLADISHQTKTPIANLNLYGELLAESELSEEQRGNVEALLGQTEKLRFLIDALVKLSRLETGILNLAPREGDVCKLLRGLCEQSRPRAERKGLALEWTESRDGRSRLVQDQEAEPVRAVFDAKWTAEALENILDNAIKYTDAGKVVLSVVAYELFARIDITDTGVGISEEEQAKIFGRFYRGESAQAREGVGIGLYLAREILAQEDGYIKVHSNPGEGATFSVFLPRDRRELPSKQAFQAGSESP